MRLGSRRSRRLKKLLRKVITRCIDNTKENSKCSHLVLFAKNSSGIFFFEDLSLNTKEALSISTRLLSCNLKSHVPAGDVKLQFSLLNNVPQNCE